MKEQERKKKIKINKAKRKKRSGYKKELKRFDPILKEIFSKAAGKISSLLLKIFEDWKIISINY